MSESSLLVASTGGHLTQLIELADRISGPSERTWITFDSAQARSALAGERVEWVPYVEPRGYGALVRSIPGAVARLRRLRPTQVVSTGSGVALAYLPFARLVGASAHYIESATRADGPSKTGELLARSKRISLYTQHPGWADDRWRFRGSVFDGFQVSESPVRSVQRVVVTLGTIEGYGFRRLLDRLVDVLPESAEVLWQTGVTDTTGLDIDPRAAVPSEELRAAITAADVVIAHAGTGSALTAMELGKRPVLVPRVAAHNEHVDDHQRQTATFLGGAELATVMEADEITLDGLVDATGFVVTRRSDQSRIQLDV